MKFIHTGDLHLDSPFLGLTEMPDQLWKQVHQSTFTAFKRIVDAAINQTVDFVLIVGDIYDRDHHSAEAEDFFAEQCQRLADHHIPVYLSYGNHDYQRVTSRFLLPENVHVFHNQVETKTLTLNSGQRVAVTGFSYDQRWLDQDYAAQYPQRPADVDWQIGMLHGAVRTGNDQQDHYAPFTTSELLALHYDYWALGHIHKHQVLNEQPPVVYCGNPQGRHKNEDGQHGYYLVESHGDHLVPEFCSVAPIEWHQETVTVNGDETSQQLVDDIIQQVDNPTAEDAFEMVEVQLPTDQLSAGLKRQVLAGAILERLQNTCEDQQLRWWPYQLTLQSISEQLPKITDLDEKYWSESAKHVFISDQIMELAGKLANYPFVADHLEDQHLITELQKSATQLLGQGGVGDEN